MTINAFHPDFMKTHYPNFWSVTIADAKQKAAGVINGGKSKATRESKKGKTVNSIHAFPKTKPIESLAEKKKRMLEVRDFRVYSEAGMPKP
jgi:hypothetical protein